MSISLNLHPPNDYWESIEAQLNDAGQGSCVSIILDGYAGACFSLHYGTEENKLEFIRKLKTAIAALPDECSKRKDTFCWDTAIALMKGKEAEILAEKGDLSKERGG